MLKNFLNISKSIKLAIPHKLLKQIYIIYFCLIIAAVLEMIGLGSIPFFIGILLDSGTHFQIFGLNLTDAIKNIFNEKNFLIYFPLIIISIFLIKNIVMFIIIFLETSIVRNIKVYFIKTLFKIYIHKPYDFYLNKNSAEIIKNIFNETQTTTSMVTNLLKFVRELTILIVIGGLILLYEPLISLSAISILVLCLLIFYYLFNNYILNLGKLRLRLLDYVLNGIQSLSGAIKDIKIYKKENYFNEKFALDAENYENVIFKQSFLEKTPRIIFEMLAVVIVFSIVSIYFYFEGDINSLIPVLALFAVSLIRLIPAFTSMSTSLYYMRYVKTSFDHVTKQIIEFKTVKNSDKGIVRDFFELKNMIASIENLNFNYQKTSKIKSISEVNFNIKTGDMVGVIGKSGAGKSTLVNLLLGLLPATTGEIKINAKEKETKNLFSYVPQDIFLLDDSLRKNIAFGESINEINENEIKKTVEMSGLTPLVEKNKEGLDLIVGERGVRLSGGEKQRVGIARALYKKSKILILDEATSSLDIVTEKKIMNSINQLKNKFTIIIVTHRLSTIESCNRIFLIKDGKLIDEGDLNYLKEKHPKEFLL
jgi:ABC-type multidrug transport system fused ATPase/permease subunit